MKYESVFIGIKCLVVFLIIVMAFMEQYEKRGNEERNYEVHIF